MASTHVPRDGVEASLSDAEAPSTVKRSSSAVQFDNTLLVGTSASTAKPSLLRYSKLIKQKAFGNGQPAPTQHDPAAAAAPHAVRQLAVPEARFNSSAVPSRPALKSSGYVGSQSDTNEYHGPTPQSAAGAVYLSALGAGGSSAVGSPDGDVHVTRSFGAGRTAGRVAYEPASSYRGDAPSSAAAGGIPMSRIFGSAAAAPPASLFSAAIGSALGATLGSQSTRPAPASGGVALSRIYSGAPIPPAAAFAPPHQHSTTDGWGAAAAAAQSEAAAQAQLFGAGAFSGLPGGNPISDQANSRSSRGAAALAAAAAKRQAEVQPDDTAVSIDQSQSATAGAAPSGPGGGGAGGSGGTGGAPVGGVGGGGGADFKDDASGSVIVPPGSSQPLPTLAMQLTMRALIAGLIVGCAFALLAQRLVLVAGLMPSFQAAIAFGCWVVLRGFTWILGRDISCISMLSGQEVAVATAAALACAGSVYVGGFGPVMDALSTTAFEQIGGSNQAGNRPVDVVAFPYWRGVVWLMLVGIVGGLLVVPFRRALFSQAGMMFPTGALPLGEGGVCACPCARARADAHAFVHACMRAPVFAHVCMCAHACVPGGRL